jgi:arsenite methyltransferase
MTTTPESDTTRDAVRQRYAEIARGTMAETTEASATGCCAPSCCAGEGLDVTTLATSIAYTASDLSDLPDGANLGLSCGNPTALASLQPGEVVLDLGSGGGFDVLLAGPKVGEPGRAIGVDMTPDMLTLARKNMQIYRGHTGLDNVEFRLGEIEHLPVADASVAEDDCPRLYPFARHTLHWPFDDPAQAEGSTEERLRTFRKVRGQIASRVRAWLQELEVNASRSTP